MNTKKECAVKILNSKESTFAEIQTLRICRNHPNIVQLVDVIKDDAYTYIVTELLKGEELFKLSKMRRFTEDDVRIVFSQILDAVQFMHDKGIVHRDLKLENIMVVNNKSNPLTVKIVDFGFAYMQKDLVDASVLCYTLDYAAPEVLSNGEYTNACDLWSLGVILYILLCGHKPFGGDAKMRKEKNSHAQIKEKIINRIRTGSFDQDSSEWRKLSKAAKDLICKLFTVEWTDRIDINEIRQHAWLLNENAMEVEDHQPPAPPIMPVKNVEIPETVHSNGENMVDVAIPSTEEITTKLAIREPSVPTCNTKAVVALESSAASELGGSKYSCSIEDDSESNIHRSISMETEETDNNIITEVLNNNNDKFIEEVETTIAERSTSAITYILEESELPITNNRSEDNSNDIDIETDDSDSFAGFAKPDSSRVHDILKIIDFNLILRKCKLHRAQGGSISPYKQQQQRTVSKQQFHVNKRSSLKKEPVKKNSPQEKKQPAVKRRKNSADSRPAKKAATSTPSAGAPKRFTRSTARRPEISADRPSSVGIDLSFS